MSHPTRTEKKAMIEAALDYVFTDVEELARQVAGEHALINMGQELEDHVPYFGAKPEALLYNCFNSFYQQSESDEMAEGTMDEYRSWLDQARKDIKAVQKKKLPLTPRNVRCAFLKEGPFAKKTKK